MSSVIAALNGNQAAAEAVIRCRPHVVACYPITPQTPLVEVLAKAVADGRLDCELCEVESEHSALSVLTGAALCGARTFTATSSQGLALMYEPYFRASTLRLPIVMAVVNREMISPQTVWGGPQDALTLRDAGWIQLYVEDNQEIVDVIIQAYRIAEDPDVLLPVNVCFDGFYLSHMTERVELPDAEQVAAFLSDGRRAPLLDPDRPLSVDPLTPGHLLTRYRQDHIEAMRRAMRAIDEVDREFARHFGRAYGGVVQRYRMEDARYALVVYGSMAGAAREAVDVCRDSGIPAGLVRLRSVRPFPVETLRASLGNLEGYGVVDRAVSFGWGTGLLFPEVFAAVPDVPAVSFVGGLGGEDLTVPMMVRAIEETVAAARSSEITPKAVRWLSSQAIRPPREG